MKRWFFAMALEPLIGYVDLQKAILTVEEGKRAKASIRQTYEAKQKALSKKEEALKSLKDQIDAEAAVDTPEARSRRAQFQSELMELQQSSMKEQQELQVLEQKQIAAITEKMRAVIEEIGRAGGYTLVLEIQGNRLLFAKDHLNLTNEVIRKYNAKYK